MLLHILVFLVVAFLFLHIRFQLKVNNALEIYEIDYTTNEELQSVCDSRVPVVFTPSREFLPMNPEKFSKHQKAMNVQMFSAKTGPPSDIKWPSSLASNGGPIPLAFQAAQESMKLPTDDKQYSAFNSEFVDESELAAEEYAPYDYLFRPPFTIISTYDYIFGSHESTTPLQYHMDYRRFLYVTSGHLKIRFAAWKNKKYLHEIQNLKDFVFFSPVDPWNPQPEYQSDHDRIRFVDIDIPQGKMVFIPPYCWYSLMFTSVDDTLCALQSFSYKTAMNYVAITPHFFLHHFSVLTM